MQTRALRIADRGWVGRGSRRACAAVSFLIFNFAFLISAPAPVVTGTNALPGLIFTYQHPAFFNGIEYGVTRFPVPTDTNGVFSTNLWPGDWKVEIGPHSDLFLFTLTNDATIHYLPDLLNGIPVSAPNVDYNTDSTAFQTDSTVPTTDTQ